VRYLPDCGHGLVCRSEKYFLPGISFVEFLHTRAIGEPAHWNNQSNSCLPLGARRRCSARSSILARRVTSHPCHADHVLSPRIVRIIQGLAEDWHRLDERIDHLSDEIAALARQDAGCERQSVLERPRLRRPARRPLPKFESWGPLEKCCSLRELRLACAAPFARLHQRNRKHAGDGASCLLQCEALTQCRHGARRLPA
jgi:hypothetical protein